MYKMYVDIPATNIIIIVMRFRIACSVKSQKFAMSLSTKTVICVFAAYTLVLVIYCVYQLHVHYRPTIAITTMSPEVNFRSESVISSLTSNCSPTRTCSKSGDAGGSTNQQLWYNIGPDTILWHVPHYEDRPFAYGGPSIVLMIFHKYNLSLPNLTLLVDNKECIKTCQWIPFGKLVQVDFETNYLYFAVFKLSASKKSVPKTVQLMIKGFAITGELPVYYNNPDTKIEFATCLYKGLFAKEDDILDIASWIEINRAVGVEHITIYNQDLPQKIISMLNEYKKEGYVDLIDWKIHNPHFKIANNGQVGTTNDCLYRYLRRAKYILFIDADELIIPHSVTTLPKMMKLIESENVTQYRFYNSFWHDVGNFLNSTNGKYTFNRNDSGLIPIHFKRTTRTKNCPPTSRFKNIVKTSGAIRVGIHHVYCMKHGQREIAVKENFGLMHHYRININFDYDKEETVHDPVMSRYLDQVMINLKKRISKFDVHINGQTY